MSETATQLIATARNAGIMLWVERGALKFRAPTGTLTGELREAIRANRDAVIATLQEGNTLTEDPANQYEPFALTDIQAAYLLGRSSTYQTGGIACHAYLEVDMGPIDRVRLERALDLLIARHGALRTSFHTAGFQQVHPVSEITRPPVAEVDATGLPALIAKFSHEVLDAENPPLLRLGISRGATASDDRLHVSVDFLMADWTGITLLIDQLVALLSATTSWPLRWTSPITVSRPTAGSGANGWGPPRSRQSCRWSLHVPMPRRRSHGTPTRSARRPPSPSSTAPGQPGSRPRPSR